MWDKRIPRPSTCRPTGAGRGHVPRPLRRSVNGRIRLDVPRDFDAEVTAHTDNGRVKAEGARGRNGGVPRSGHWLFGEPRGHIRLETENGEIELHRR
jgi:hypothetical protein